MVQVDLASLLVFTFLGGVVVGVLVMLLAREPHESLPPRERDWQWHEERTETHEEPPTE